MLVNQYLFYSLETLKMEIVFLYDFIAIFKQSFIYNEIYIFVFACNNCNIVQVVALVQFYY